MALRVALAQLDPVVGDIDGNVARILAAWRRAAEAGADLVVCTELAVTGYPPEDLLLKPEVVARNLAAVDHLAAEGPAGTVAVVGYVGAGGDEDDGDQPVDVTVSARDLRNSAAVLADGRVVGTYDKLRLPNYGVFDEARYFRPADDRLVVRVAGVPVGVTICEDLWTEGGPVARAVEAGARVVCSLNASPYHRGKRAARERWLAHHATAGGAWLLYVNAVGAQDEVVFDGDSIVMGPDGTVVARGPQFTEDLLLVDLDVAAGPADAVADLPGAAGVPPALAPRRDPPRLDPVAEVWHALVTGIRGYCRKNGFADVVLGLSGGIDSALVAALATAALGPDHVLGVAMPSPHSSEHSLTDAEELARNLGIGWRCLPIGPAMATVDETLAELFAGTEPGVAEENIQARLRGLLLMAISNRFGHLLLATGNKSEAAVGYATLYGDMAGGFAPIIDVKKTLVYELARWHNEHGPGAGGRRIPRSSIEKAPSAELRPGQTDQDSLPPYDQLDDIITAYVEHDLGIAAITRRGHDEATVRDVIRRIDGAEFKRRQAAPGIKITERAFGRDRRVPITNRWTG